MLYIILFQQLKAILHILTSVILYFYTMVVYENAIIITLPT